MRDQRHQRIAQRHHLDGMTLELDIELLMADMRLRHADAHLLQHEPHEIGAAVRNRGEKRQTPALLRPSKTASSNPRIRGGAVCVRSLA